MPRRKPNRPSRLDNEERRRQQWNMGQRREEVEEEGEGSNEDLIQGEMFLLQD